MTQFLKIIEIMWAIVAVVAAVTAVVRATAGQSWGNYLYVSLFTACIAVFMYFFKKRNRHFMEDYYRRKESRKEQGSAD